MFGSKKKKKAKPAPKPAVAPVAGDDFFEFEGANIAPADATLGARVQKSTGKKSGITEGRVTKYTVNPKDGTATFETNIVPPGFPGNRPRPDLTATERRYGIRRVTEPVEPEPETLVGKAVEKVANIFRPKSKKKTKVKGIVVVGADSVKIVGKPKEEDYQRCLAAEIGDMEEDDELDLGL